MRPKKRTIGAMQKKKAQITFFIILGIVILFTIALFYFFMFKGKIVRNEAEQERAGDISIRKEKYLSFVNHCVENSASEGIFLIGKQGGVIYDYQVKGTKLYLGPPLIPYGQYVFPFLDDGTGLVYNVSYGIMRPGKDEFHMEPPFYPYGIIKLVSNPSKEIYSSYVNPFGNNPAPGPFAPLCDYNGKNSLQKNDKHFACESYDSANSFVHSSIQEYLEKYIEKKTVECVNFNQFVELKNATIERGNITVKTILSYSSLAIEVVYPISITMPNNKQQINLERYSVIIKTRIKQIHELATRLINEDVNDIFFDIVKDASYINTCNAIYGGNAVCLKKNMKVVKITDPCLSSGLCKVAGMYDDVLMIIDNSSSYGGRPYVFQFAIQNRYPALDLVRQSSSLTGYGFDYIGIVGDEIIIDPKGYDPDEDNYGSNFYMDGIYKYSLWKESYNDHYNNILCTANPTLCESDPEQAVWRGDSNNPADIPHSWTNSVLFMTTGRSANFTLTEDDRGLHYLKVEVCDRENFCDYQYARIVVGMADVNISTNFFPDINNRFVSLEDPYKIVFPIIPGIVPSRYVFEFYNSSGTKYLTKDTTNRILMLPKDAPDFSTIKTDMYTFFPGLGNYKVKMFVYAGGINYVHNIELQLTAFECLPHGKNPDLLPYPFNADSDPFKGGHICCKGDPIDSTTPGWGTYETSSVKCYSQEEFGCKDDTRYINPSSLIVGTPIYYNPYSFPPDTNTNQIDNVYSRSLDVYCSGNRGNSCFNSAVDTRSAIIDCSSPCKTCDYSKDYCIDSGSGLLCNSAWKCTNGNYNLDGTANPFSSYAAPQTYGKVLCQAGCSGGSCDLPINCTCNITSCGAECDETKMWIWDDKACSYNCNGWGDSAYSETCNYHNVSTTVCSAPDYASTTSETFITQNGVSIPVKAGPEAGRNINDLIDGNINLPIISYCYDSSSNKCHVSSCTDFDAIEFDDETCGPGGNALYSARLSKYVCLSDTPDCDYNARCTSGVEDALINANIADIGTGSASSFNSNTPFVGSNTNNCYFSPAGDYCDTGGVWSISLDSSPPSIPPASCPMPSSYQCHNITGGTGGCGSPIAILGTTTCTSTGWKCECPCSTPICPSLGAPHFCR